MGATWKPSSEVIIALQLSIGSQHEERRGWSGQGGSPSQRRGDWRDRPRLPHLKRPGAIRRRRSFRQISLIHDFHL